MKNILIFILVFACLKVSAQIEKPIYKGNYIIGGNISGSYSNNTLTETVNYTINNTFSSDNFKIKTTNYNFSFSPNIGYFITNGLATGITPILSYQKSENNSNNGSGVSKVYSIGIGTYLKYYFQNGFFVNMSIQYQYNKTHNTNEYIYRDLATSTIDGKEDIVSNNQYNTFGISPGLGYAIFVNSKISLETMISYLYQRQTGPISSDTEVNFPDSPNSDQHNSTSGTIVGNINGLYLTVGLNIFLK
jgi:hypothetical protein